MRIFVGIGLGLVFLAWSLGVGMAAQGDTPAIEWLEFAVPPTRQAFFLQQDEAVWEPFLRQYPAYAGKEVWVRPPDRLILVLRWRSRVAWKAIPAGEIDRVEQTFRGRVGSEFPLVRAQEFGWLQP